MIKELEINDYDENCEGKYPGKEAVLKSIVSREYRGLFLPEGGQVGMAVFAFAGPFGDRFLAVGAGGGSFGDAHNSKLL
ncbi:MAG: hypothetical protein WAU88_07760 [Candidatus Zixiibacteriota bacterium]